MKMLGLAIMTLIVSSSVHAKTYFDETNQRALVYFMQGENVNASVCEGVTEQELRRSLEQTTATKCKKLSEKGLSKEDIEKKLPEIKKRMLKVMGLLNDFTVDLGETAAQHGMGLFKGLFSDTFKKQKEAIENYSAEDVFEVYELDGRAPTLELKDGKHLDNEIETFLMIAPK